MLHKCSNAKIGDFMKILNKGIIGLILTLALSLQFYTTELDACATPLARYAIGSESTGNVFVWLDLSTSLKTIKSVIMAPDGTVGNPVTVSSAGQNCYEPQLRMTASGDAIAAWLAIDANKQTYTLYAATLPIGGIWSTPISLSNSIEGVLPNTVTLSINSAGAIEAFYESITYYLNQSGKLVTKEEVRLAKGTVMGGWNPAQTLVVIRE
jgi:hypothetical protein